MAKRKINWTEIRARYESGEPPREIAKDFQKCDGKKIGSKASRDGWVQKKREKQEEIAQAVHEAQKDTLSDLCRLTEELHLDFLRKLKNKRADGTCMMDDIQNPYLFDGERVNSLFQTVLNNATKILLARLKYEAGQADETDDMSQFILNIRRQSDVLGQETAEDTD